jgi:hypothetical protein
MNAKIQNEKVCPSPFPSPQWGEGGVSGIQRGEGNFLWVDIRELKVLNGSSKQNGKSPHPPFTKGG